MYFCLVLCVVLARYSIGLEPLFLYAVSESISNDLYRGPSFLADRMMRLHTHSSPVSKLDRRTQRKNEKEGQFADGRGEVGGGRGAEDSLVVYK